MRRGRFARLRRAGIGEPASAYVYVFQNVRVYCMYVGVLYIHTQKVHMWFARLRRAGPVLGFEPTRRARSARRVGLKGFDAASAAAHCQRAQWTMGRLRRDSRAQGVPPGAPGEWVQMGSSGGFVGPTMDPTGVDCANAPACCTLASNTYRFEWARPIRPWTDSDRQTGGDDPPPGVDWLELQAS